MKCAESDELTTSTAWMLEEYSWPMRWNTRSAPVRSTRTEMPGYFASNALAIRSPNLRHAKAGVNRKFVYGGTSDLNFDHEVGWRINRQVDFCLTADALNILQIEAGVWLDTLL